MKRIIIILLFCFPGRCLLAQNCNEDSFMRIITPWRKIADANMEPHKQINQIISRIDRLQKLFQAAHPEPRGTDAKWYRTMNPYPLVPGGPSGYNFNSSFRLFYCNRYTDKRELDERANTGEVHINSLIDFLWEQGDKLQTTVEGQDVYRLPHPVGEWKGYPVYGFTDETGGRRSVLLMRNNQKPWKAVTQLQYLTALKAGWETQKRKMSVNFEEQIKSLEKSIKEYENNKELPAAHRQEIIANLKKGIETWEKNRETETERSNQLWDQKISVIENYIKEHADNLNDAAVIQLSSDMVDNFSGSFSDLERGGYLLVVLDHQYFEKSLPSDVPQLMVLSWSWYNTPAGLYFKKNIEENFAVSELEKMIGN